MLCVRKTFYWPPIQNMNMSYLVTWYLYCHTKTLVCTLTAYFRWSFVHDIAAWFVFESWRMANISEGWRYQIGWIFGKIPNSLRPSRLIFGKWYCNFLWHDYGSIYARRYDGWIVWNTCTWFPEIGTILRGRGQLLFGTFRKIHPI